MDKGPVCVVAANPPAPGTSIQGTTAQGTSVQVTPGTTWQQVATLQGPVASDLGLPAGQTMNVFCAPTGSQNPQGQPTGYQPGQTNLGQTNPAQAPLQNPTGPQNPAPGQQETASFVDVLVDGVECGAEFGWGLGLVGGEEGG